GYLASGQSISASALLHLVCDAQIVPVIFSDTGGILAYGRERRLASVGQRLALAARDGGCSFPGCDRPPAWTEAHHVREWITGGPTNLDNMTLLCGHHHRSFEKAGWHVHIQDGIPWWTPPPFVDPTQTPIRNTTHHRPEIVFRQPVPA
ncbi:MAG TPA: HNH endonuclease signature motif containing protein, partial [Jatrophihabitans sp.]|nr:HNH endonuclease signature motif containing protein [Jatrophihabitans sp.]